MATKTEQLRAALLALGYTEADTRSGRPCLTGKNGKGPVWIWLDKVGSGRYAYSSRIGVAMALQDNTVRKVLAGKPSSVLPRQ